MRAWRGLGYAVSVNPDTTLRRDVTLPSRGELQQWLVIERDDSSRAVFSVYKNGGCCTIVTDQGGEHLVSRDQTVERELRIAYHAKIVRPVTLSEGYPSLD
jgi:hypothetical protein